jgi:hypothetical protein
MLRLFLIVCKVSLREKTELMGFTLYLLRFTPFEDIIPSGPEAFRARGLLERTPLEIYL